MDSEIKLPGVHIDFTHKQSVYAVFNGHRIPLGKWVESIKDSKTESICAISSLVYIYLLNQWKLQNRDYSIYESLYDDELSEHITRVSHHLSAYDDLEMCLTAKKVGLKIARLSHLIDVWLVLVN